MDFGSIGAGAKPGCTGTGLAPGAPGGFTGERPGLWAAALVPTGFAYWMCRCWPRTAKFLAQRHLVVIRST